MIDLTQPSDEEKEAPAPAPASTDLTNSEEEEVPGPAKRRRVDESSPVGPGPSDPLYDTNPAKKDMKPYQRAYVDYEREVHEALRKADIQVHECQLLDGMDGLWNSCARAPTINGWRDGGYPNFYATVCTPAKEKPLSMVSDTLTYKLTHTLEAHLNNGPDARLYPPPPGTQAHEVRLPADLKAMFSDASLSLADLLDKATFVRMIRSAGAPLRRYIYPTGMVFVWRILREQLDPAAAEHEGNYNKNYYK